MGAHRDMPIVRESVNPARCRVWEMHNRLGEDFGSGSCQALLESIRAHGQKQPVLARRITPTDGYEFEVIYGARRLIVAQQLGIDLLLECRELDDQSALVEMDIENRVRQDISAYERGLSYRRWLNAGYFPNQLALAKALGISSPQVCRLLRYADLPAVVLAAFPSPHDIREEWAGRLAKYCRDPSKRQQILTRARAARSLPRTRSAQATYEALLASARATGGRGVRDRVIKNSNGIPLFRLAFRSRTVHVVIPLERLGTDLLDVIAAQIARALEETPHTPSDPGLPAVKRQEASTLI
jgi:ParB/RepB/Spo0J family partition protein